jgi:site-specific recombinase XerD
MLSQYEIHLSRLPLSPHTRRNYLLRVRQFLAWLDGCEDKSDALTDLVERDFAIREFKCWLLQHGRKASTVNATLAAVDNFYMYQGLGPAKTRRQELPKQAPRALDSAEQYRLLKALAKSTSLRNRTMAMLMLHCGLRISEVCQLNVSDVLLAARKRELIVRCGKNDKRRVIPINKEAGEVLQEFLSSGRVADDNAPFFVSQKGNRLSSQAIDNVIRGFGRESGVTLSSHRLRHTCLTRLVRAGVDIVTVAEIAGHSRIETTRRYSLPTADVMIAAVEKLNYATSPQ